MRTSHGRSRVRSLGRGLKALLLAALAAGMSWMVLIMLSWLGPVPNPQFIHVRLADDVKLLEHSGVDKCETVDQPGTSQLLAELARWRKLPARDGLIVHISARALADARGQVYVLPVNAALDSPLTWVPLKEVLQALRANQARNKLLVLDIMRRWSDPWLATSSPDIAAGLYRALEEVPDAGRLVLCACAAGQLSHMAAARGQSLFAYYLEEGLRGYADGHGSAGERDGLVMARELAAFVQTRVAHAAKRYHGQVQTPVLFGTGDDFTLVALPHRRPREHVASAATPQPYPQWLYDAWRARDMLQGAGRHATSPRAFQRLQAVLIDAESAWRHGVGDAKRDRERRQSFAALHAEIVRHAAQTAHERTSLSAFDAPGGNAVCLAAVQDVLARYRQQSPGLSSKDRSDLVARLLAGFRGKVRDATAEDTARALWSAAVATQRSDAETLDLLDRMSRALSAAPRHVEMLLLQQLGELARRGDVEPWPRAAVQQALQAAAAGEKLMRPQLFPWVRARLMQAAQTRHDGEMLLWARGFADCGQAASLLKQAARLYRDSAEIAGPVAAAQRAIDQGFCLLPWFPCYLEHDQNRLAGWEAASRTLVELHELLCRGNMESPDADAVEAIAQALERFNNLLAELTQPFLPEKVKQLTHAARSSRADGNTYRRIEALLSMPLLRAEERVGLANAGRELAERLPQMTSEPEQQDDVRPMPAAVEQEQAVPQDGPAAERRTAMALILAELAGLNRERLQALHKARKAAKSSGDWAALAGDVQSLWIRELAGDYRQAALPQRVRLSWVAPPYTRCPGIDDTPTPAMTLASKKQQAWWEWLSGQYLYQARDYQGAGLDGEGAAAARQFYQQAAFANPGLHQPSPAESLVIRARQMPRPLSMLSPESRAVLEISPAMTAQLHGPIRVDAIRPVSWLDVTPAAVSFASFSARGAKNVPLRVRLKPLAERGRGARPSGFLVQAAYADRHYHFLVPVTLESGPNDLQILLGPDAAQPDAELRQIHLRAGKAPQAYHLFARNPSARPRLVHIKVRNGGRLLAESSAPLRLPARETVTVSLRDLRGAGDIEVKGPLQLLLLDAENGDAVLDARQVPLRIAAPAEYVRVAEAVLTSAGVNQHGLRIRLHATGAVSGPPIAAELALSPLLKGASAGTFRGELRGAGPLTLFVEKLSLPGKGSGDSWIHLHVDGVSRAFSYRLKWGSEGVYLLPQTAAAPRVHLGMPPFIMPQKDYRFPLEVDRAPPATTLEVRLGRIGHAGFEAEATRLFPADRDRRMAMQLDGPGRALVFRASEQDWMVDLDVSKVSGQRLLQARLIDDLGNDIQQAMQAVTVDHGAPGAIRFVGMPARARRGTLLTVRATAEADSGIGAVTWFVGRPVQGKIPAGAKTFAGRSPAADSTVWTGALPLPNRVGPVEISALIANRAGKAVFATMVIDLTEVDPALLGNGAITGRVLEGGRTQPDLEVVLEDDAGHEVGHTRTRRDGVFRFDEVAPGRYMLRTFKPASGRRGAIAITVNPGQTEDVAINLSL